jgi:hypothetical protein
MGSPPAELWVKPLSHFSAGILRGQPTDEIRTAQAIAGMLADQSLDRVVICCNAAILALSLTSRRRTTTIGPVYPKGSDGMDDLIEPLGRSR